jgi:uncharacterized membrane protein YgcG
MNTQKKRKSLVSCLLMLLLLVITCSSITAQANSSYEFPVIEATSDFYVNDFAGLFTEEEKASMMERAIELEEEYGGIQVVVTTVKTLDDCLIEEGEKDIEQIAYAMFKQYGIGQDDMGILILFASEDRIMRIETGYQMQTYITDAKAVELRDKYGMEYFRNNQFVEGIISLQKATISEIKSEVPQDWKPLIGDKKETSTRENNNGVVQTNTAKADSKKNGISGAMYAIWTALIAMLVGLGVAIRGLFSTKSKANAEKETYEQEFASLRKSTSKKVQEAVDVNSETWRLAMEQQKSAYEKQCSELSSKIEGQIKTLESKEREILRLNQELSGKKAELEKMEDTYSRIKTLHPDLDFENEVKNMIENEFKASAENVDEQIAQIANLTADKDKINVFDEAIRVYQSASADVQKYVNTDVGKLRRLYEESVSLRREYERAEQEKRDRATAKSAFEKMGAIVSGISFGNYENYETLDRAYKVYTGLSSAEKNYFPDMAIVEKIKSLRATAEADLKDFNTAKEAEKDVRRIVDRIYTAHEEDQDSLERAMRYYRNLTSAQQRYFSSDLERKVKHFLDEAEDDHRRKEAERRQRKEEERRRKEREEAERRHREEERRRRQREEEERRRRQSSSFSSSSHHSSSHSGHRGHGGRPSGGGATGRF